MLALVDCNSFYTACERLFRPDLAGRALIVLSNNDGCVIARCPQAKALGVAMGQPYFQVRALAQRARIAVFSSNYPLYADMSARVMATLESLVPAVETYSIDEAFVDLAGLDAEAQALRLQGTVEAHTGIPVSVGVASTKTLAKLANWAAKRYPACQGRVVLADRARCRRLLALVPVEEVWGVGRRLGRRLHEQGINTALQLADSDPALIRRRYSVVLERTLRELNGEPCLSLQTLLADRQQVLCSRSFGRSVSERAVLHNALTTFTSRAAARLRQQGLSAAWLTVMLRPRGEGRASLHAGIALQPPSNDSGVLVAAAMVLVDRLWREGGAYSKGGVMLTGLQPAGQSQGSLFSEGRGLADPRRQALMALMDRLNRDGATRLGYARDFQQRQWQPRRALLSPAYTTRWDCLPVVK